MPDEDGESRPRQLGAADEIHQPELLGDLPVRRPADRRRLAPRAHHLVATRIAVRHLGERWVGDEQRLRIEHGLDVTQLVLEGGDPLTVLSALLDDFRGELPVLLHELRVGLREFVALRLQLVELARERTAADVERFELVEQLRRSEEHTSELQSRPHLVCRLLLEKKKTTNRSKW